MSEEEGGRRDTAGPARSQVTHARHGTTRLAALRCKRSGHGGGPQRDRRRRGRAGARGCAHPITMSASSEMMLMSRSGAAGSAARASLLNRWMSFATVSSCCHVRANTSTPHWSTSSANSACCRSSPRPSCVSERTQIASSPGCCRRAAALVLDRYSKFRARFCDHRQRAETTSWVASVGGRAGDRKTCCVSCYRKTSETTGSMRLVRQAHAAFPVAHREHLVLGVAADPEHD